MRSLAELTAIVHGTTREISRELKWELCSACKLEVCIPKGRQCALRAEINRRKRARYAKNPEAFRVYNRTPNMKPEQAQKRREQRKQYWQECKDAILLKARMRRAANPEKYRAIEKAQRERRKAKQQRKLQEGATQ